MLFNSPSFAVFFPIVTIGYFLIPHRYRWMWLLAASCYFYMSFIPAYVLILAFTIANDFAAGLLIEKSEGRARKQALLLSIAGNIGVLVIFKYFNFLNTNLAGLAHFLDWNYPIQNLGLVLPIGLSFHTFQSMSYTIDVYRGHFRAERHPGMLALYVMFYPQLVAGPIERPGHLLPQFYEKHQFEYRRVTDGFKLMLWGFFKKVVIADRLAVVVNQVYNHPADYQGIILILATVFFAYQIYCDFSGYSDIAIGVAQVMGFRLIDNFKQPYFARSVAEFWKRWHISLSTWFRDYLYIPLGGNRVVRWRWQLNLLITFLVSGLWHGANWTFLVWGALHGSYLLASTWMENIRLRIAHMLKLSRIPGQDYMRIIATFVLVSFAWIFFRANSLNDAFYITSHLFSGFGILTMSSLGAMLDSLALSRTQLLIAVGSIFVLELVQALQQRGSVRQQLAQAPVWFRWGIYYAGILAVLLFGVFSNSPFIYFQF